MSSYTFSQKTFTPVPPEKGSFPLDHQGICKEIMMKYMRCLKESKNKNKMCKNVAKEYLGCRMDNELMAREEWSKLGFVEAPSKQT
ncbi:cytochrome c oxidase assembly protein COX19 [Orussus abietinus]|uniref:cytochrome c oxidase assembly protein COX19 n=1 Tax=Orussus abietinus TaxID=222816 RepID=UPI0006254084|nr:cytochrome c oxidase assembly protein COX19 [Orussus abietinus]XP_012272510.1 cytochrome c oxidase assembly protein COX19 [Orussus abietinus]